MHLIASFSTLLCQCQKILQTADEIFDIYTPQNAFFFKNGQMSHVLNSPRRPKKHSQKIRNNLCVVLLHPDNRLSKIY